MAKILTIYYLLSLWVLDLAILTAVSAQQYTSCRLLFYYSLLTGDLSNELVRHFLIEPTSKGVRLKGCPNEPVFGKISFSHIINGKLFNI